VTSHASYLCSKWFPWCVSWFAFPLLHFHLSVRRRPTLSRVYSVIGSLFVVARWNNELSLVCTQWLAVCLLSRGGTTSWVSCVLSDWQFVCCREVEQRAEHMSVECSRLGRYLHRFKLVHPHVSCVCCFTMRRMKRSKWFLVIISQSNTVWIMWNCHTHILGSQCLRSYFVSMLYLCISKKLDPLTSPVYNVY